MIDDLSLSKYKTSLVPQQSPSDCSMNNFEEIPLSKIQGDLKYENNLKNSCSSILISELELEDETANVNGGPACPQQVLQSPASVPPSLGNGVSGNLPGLVIAESYLGKVRPGTCHHEGPSNAKNTSSVPPPNCNQLPEAAHLQVLSHKDYLVVPSYGSPILKLYGDVVSSFAQLTTPSGGTTHLSAFPSTSSFNVDQLFISCPQQLVENSPLPNDKFNIISSLQLSKVTDEDQQASSSSGQLMPVEDIPLDPKILQLSRLFSRELAELIYFNRILNEAHIKSHPELERIRFLAIALQNIDVYFCKRAQKLRSDFIPTCKSLKSEDSYIAIVRSTTRDLINVAYKLFNDVLLPQLANNISILKYNDLNNEEKQKLSEYFLQMFPLITPLVVDAGHPFPNLNNLSLNIAVSLKLENGDTRFGCVTVPKTLSRFYPISQRSNYSYIPMEEIILANLDTLFPNTKILEQALFRVTRHNDLKLNEKKAKDLREHIETEIHKCKFAPMVRLEVSASMSKDIIDTLSTHLKLDEGDLFTIDGLLGLSDLFELCQVDLPHLKFEPWVPHTHNRLTSQDIFSTIRNGDLLVKLPYVSFNSSVQLFIESSVKDPHVKTIKISIYRTNPNSQLIGALCEAASRDKDVHVLVDLKASGDEVQNKKYAEQLQQAGCNVIYGIVGLKTHAKIAMVVREEEDKKLKTYMHYSTGNYNASTANFYTDIGIFSCDQELGKDMCDLFNYITGCSNITEFKKLVIAPLTMRSTLLQLIRVEAKNAREGKEATIMAVMNGLDDEMIVNELYNASMAGVTIKLVVRGRCRLLPGIPGISHNIQVISILGRFLEHSRISYFHNGNNPKAFISSADWQHRNLERRVETLVPVSDPNNIKELRDSIDVYYKDPSAWFMMSDGRYRKMLNSESSLCSQNVLMKETIKKHPVSSNK
ncbi:hypothetical protein SAMD00019534_007080 [Acytostelium subglobosum LB1]|uniref:hypothetical protein n=1 Tax=Acytostelium subglobosum LB1 TaxID=1410327 RepID=UPI000644C9E5|nr:hypothetical protein SAMD00019534_007080 [Acytostelium subglobosum LB1]GAM17533.1 hypothetical protein SAMD00019534_007080 [Acytostelium subglobosum LB1]|eukprot:XP_012759595.1 hypothetical protein SAMD00019534_007080 [Acytostelium subglobosum LB1]